MSNSPNAIRLSKHFTLEELVRSQIAARFGINNKPLKYSVRRLTALADNILEPTRVHYGIPLIISSGYRCPALNTAIGSGQGSQHLKGQAADFEIPSIANRTLANWIKANLTFDQLILEFHNPNVPDSGWVHCSYREGHNRNQCIIFDGKLYRTF